MPQVPKRTRPSQFEKRVGKEEVERIVRDYKALVSLHELARSYKSERETIRGVLLRRGVAIRKKPVRKLYCPHTDRNIFLKECKKCELAYERDHWKIYGPESNKRARIKRHLMRERTMRYLQDHPCVDCGERDIRVLEFDHVAPHTKERAVAHTYRGNWSTVLREIEKCEVRCSNCHKKRTLYQRGATFYGLEYVKGSGISEDTDPMRVKFKILGGELHAQKVS